MVNSTFVIMSGQSQSGLDLAMGNTYENMYVFSGGSSVDTTLHYFGAQQIFSGGTDTGTQIYSGGSQTLQNDGATFNTIVYDGGTQDVTSLGSATDTTISGSGRVLLEDGGHLYGPLVMAGSGGQLVLNGQDELADNFILSGFSTGDTIDFKNLTYVSSQTSASYTYLSGSPGYLTVTNGTDTYTVNVNVIDSGERLRVTSDTRGGTLLTIRGDEILVTGVTSTGLVLKNDPDADYISAQVYANGEILSTLIESGGAATISANGTAVDTVISSGGTQTVADSGYAFSTTISNGGQEIIGNETSGSMSSLVLSGGLQLVYGESVLTTVQSGGLEIATGYGTALGTIVSSGGVLQLGMSGITSGASSNTQILDGGLERISLSATAYSASVSSGGVQEVDVGSFASGTIVYDGGVQRVVGLGQPLAVLEYATAVGTVVSGSGTIDLEPGALLQGDVYLYGSGAQLIVSYPDNLDSSLQLIGFTGGDSIDFDSLAYSPSVSATYNSATYTLTVTDGTTQYNVMMPNDFTGWEFYTSQDADGSTLLQISYRDLYVSGGETSANVQLGPDVTAYPHTNMYVLNGGTASATQVTSGGSVTVSNGGLAAATTLSSGGVQHVSGTASGTIILNGGIQIVSGTAWTGIASNTIISSGGTEIVGSQGDAFSSQISAGGVQIVSNGGAIVSGTIVSSGGELHVMSGNAISAVIQSSGSAVVDAGGGLGAATILSGGHAYISGGGNQTVIQNGGVQTVLAGGSAAYTVISSGGVLDVESGGRIITTNTISSGGIIDVVSGGTISGSIIMVGSGAELRIAAPGNLGGNPLLGGFSGSFGEGDLIDLSSVAFGTGGTAVLDSSAALTNGMISTLTLTSGSDTYTLRLFGDYTGWGISAYAAQDQSTLLTPERLGIIVSTLSSSLAVGGSNPDEYMWVMSTGYSGTTSPGLAISTTVAAGGMQFVLGSANVTTVLSGGEQRVSSGGIAIGTTVSSGGQQYVLSRGVATGSVIDGAGTITVQTGGILSGTLTMEGSGAQLDVFAANSLASGFSISGFSSGDVIDLTALVYNSATTSLSFNQSTDILSVVRGGQSYQFTLQGDYAGWVFSQSENSTDSTTLITAQQNAIIVSSGVTSTGVSFGGSNPVSSMIVMNGGTASATTVNSGGVQAVSGSAISTIVNSGGTQNIASGGIATDTLITGSGAVLVSAGGQLSGTLDLQGSGGLLQVGDAGFSDNLVISGFTDGDTIDLNSLAYTSAVSVSFDGTTDLLTVTDGATAYTMQLAGDYSGKRIVALDDTDGSTKLSVEDEDAPDITGFITEQTGTDQVPLALLSSVGVTSEGSEGVTAVVTISGADGSFANSSGYGTVSPDGKTFTVTGSPAHITAVLDALTFTQTGGQAPAGQATTSTLTLAVTNNSGTTTRSGTIALTSALLPFAGQYFNVGDPSATITVTATLGPDSPGTYSHLGTGTLSPDGLTYTITGTAAAVSQALQQLAFVPANPGSESLEPKVSVVSSTAPVTLQNTSSTPQFMVGGSTQDVLLGGTGADTLVSGANGGTLIGNGSGTQMVGGGGTTVFDDNAGHATIYGGQGNDTINAAGGGSTIVTGPAGSQVELNSADNVVWSQGADTIYAGGVNTVIGGNAGVYLTTESASTFINGSGTSTVVGSLMATGAPTLFGGVGNLVYYAGNAGGQVVLDSGNATVVTGNASTAVFNGSGDVLYYGNSGYPDTSDTILGGTGSVTVWGGQNGYFQGGTAGDNVIQVAGQSTATGGGDGDVLTARGSNNILIAASGNETLDASSANGATMFAGSGDSTLIGGAGTAVDTFVFTDGAAGADYTIQNFNPWEDQIVLNGFSPQQIDAAYASGVNTGAGEVFTLADNSIITVLNAASISRAAFG